MGTVALLLSESKFTTATLTRALGSSVPFLLMHLTHILKMGKFVLLSRIQPLVVCMVCFAGNLMFDRNVTLVWVGGLACGFVIRGCRAGH
ncbi:hypothetical protein DFH29DRAFT_978275 [Suillus ampliporus]|nr:hypothetical protein DFH29DRAFT_978275 [Suillus ampliporus]